MNEGVWITVCGEAEVAPSDVKRFDHGEQTFAVIKTRDGRCSVIDGLCTHGKTHLADGFVDGDIIECPKHNGRFNVITGAATATPARVAVRVYETRVVNANIEVRIG